MSVWVDGTTPYPWPYDGALSRRRTALVAVGWDADRWAGCHRPEVVVEPITRLAEVVHTIITVSHGDSALDAPPALPGASAISAAGIDAFYGGPLDAVLRTAQCDLLLIVGLGLETTVHSTMRSANDRGYECLLVIDACAPLDPDLVAPATSMVEMSGGIFGAIGRTDAVLTALGLPDPSKGTS
jgi:Isochorismatase family